MKLLRYILCLCLLLSALPELEARTYVVGVGLGNYDNGKESLPCSANDVRALSQFFNQRKDCEIAILIDKNATRANILKVLKRQFAKAKVNDEIIFAYSGHGFEGGVSCFDTKNVVYSAEIQEIMAKSKAKRKVMFINSCHAGSFKYNIKSKYKNKKKYVNVLVFMSSRPKESSWESPAMKTSFFFNRVIEGMRGYADANRDRKVTARELFDYVSANVARDTDGMQHPTMFGQFPDNLVIVEN